MSSGDGVSVWKDEQILGMTVGKVTQPGECLRVPSRPPGNFVLCILYQNKKTFFKRENLLEVINK